MIGVMEKKKISHKKTQKLPSSDGMMLERLNDKIDLIIEGQDGTDSRIDQLSGRFGRLEDKVIRLDIRSSITENHLVGLEGKIIELDGKFDGLNNKFDDLNGKFDGLDNKFYDLNGKFDDLAGDVRKKADREEVVALGNRVAKLEAS